MDSVMGDVYSHEGVPEAIKAAAYLHTDNQNFMESVKQASSKSGSLTCNYVADLWFNICTSMFLAHDGYEVVIEVEGASPDMVQRVIVFEEEALMDSLLEEVPTGKLVPGPHRTMVYENKDAVHELPVRRSARNMDVFRPSPAPNSALPSPIIADNMPTKCNEGGSKRM
jgi:hypothetical protein